MNLRIMSNNIWWCDTNTDAWAARGEDCSAAVRSVGLAKVYAETAPDILGLQECTMVMTDELYRNWPEPFPYAILWSRDTPVFYRRDKFELVDSHCLVYPETIPGREGSFNNQRTKSYGIAVLREKTSGKCLVFASTHLWFDYEYRKPHSDEARVYQLGICMDKVDELRKKYSCPGIIVGDLNAVYDAPVIASAFARGYVHAHDIATEYAAEDHGYHKCDWTDYGPYIPQPFEQGIDHILIAGAPDGFVRRFERYYSDEYLPLSDHFPVWMDIQY